MSQTFTQNCIKEAVMKPDALQVMLLGMALVIVACGDDDDDRNHGGEAGMAGEAGAGGEAGMGGEAGAGGEAGMGGEAGAGGEAGMGGDAESINYTGVAADWLADGISQAYTVCVYETENCTTTDEEGNFTLETSQPTLKFFSPWSVKTMHALLSQWSPVLRTPPTPVHSPS